MAPIHPDGTSRADTAQGNGGTTSRSDPPSANRNDPLNEGVRESEHPDSQYEGVGQWHSVETETAGSPHPLPKGVDSPQGESGRSNRPAPQAPSEISNAESGGSNRNTATIPYHLWKTGMARHAGAYGLVFNGRHLPYRASLVERARILRKNMTGPERKIWFHFFHAFPSRVLRQRPIDFYIVDFYIPALRLVIEIDGAHHYTEEGKCYDAARTERLEAYGLHVIRFTNREVLREFDAVRRAIEEKLEKTT